MDHEAPPTSPFGHDDLPYLVLVNDRGQYSLWPARTPVPAGWRTVRPADSRSGALAYVEKIRTDQRPLEVPAAPAQGDPPVHIQPPAVSEQDDQAQLRE